MTMEMSTNHPPKITMDPRWKAARALVQAGQSHGAIDMFATLLEETISQYSATSLEAAVCYYEYGNAILRSQIADEASREQNVQGDTSEDAADSRREPRQPQEQDQQDEDSKPSPEVEEFSPEKEAGPNDSEDFLLSLEMMENAYSIFEEKATRQATSEWIQYQLPRVLQGLGDVLREMGRMADAADAYSRALPYREEFVEKYPENDLTIQRLKNRRLLVEANILVAEALLGCDHGKHVVTSETKDMLVTADERVDYARGYYEKAREELQETVFLMGRIAAIVPREELATEKENVCFAATMLMGVGETLAAFDEDLEKNLQEPPLKKVKTGY